MFSADPAHGLLTKLMSSDAVVLATSRLFQFWRLPLASETQAVGGQSDRRILGNRIQDDAFSSRSVASISVPQ